MKLRETDVAYQGLGSGFDEDAWSVRYFAQQGFEMIVSVLPEAARFDDLKLFCRSASHFRSIWAYMESASVLSMSEQIIHQPR